MRKTPVIAIALSLQALAAHALATEYTLTVPVQLKGLSPVVTHYALSCNLWRKKAGGGNEVVASSWSGMIPVSGGANTVQKIKFKYDGPAAGAPATYECNLQLCSSSGVNDCGWTKDGKFAQEVNFPPWRVSMPNAAYSAGVEGPLPK